ncbi:MAG: tannase/feruloyl esterase family alpha/beta hydrolase [Acidisphaera sp.]|nr:tannase/feruloyl esterase family alpha/beta hydrolase [Acidisphaera sp.]
MFENRKSCQLTRTAAAGLFVSALLAGTALCASPAHASVACTDMTSLVIPNTTIDIAQAIPAGTYTPTGSGAIANLPAFCRVHGFVSPVPGSVIGFEVWMPDAGWNTKIEMFGNGGYSSSLDYSDMGAQLIRGYATLSTDTGHAYSTDGDPDFAVGHPQAIIDWGHRAVHQSILKAKQVVHAFYGSRAAHAYFSGCSTGGHQALMEVQRYPTDFDGVIGGDPGNNRTHLNAGFLWEYLVDHPFGDDNDPILPATKLPVLTHAVIAVCQAQNGARDGGLSSDNFLNDPRDCNFDPSILQCPNNVDAPDCLTTAQIQTAQAIYAGPHDPVDGTLIENGYEPGSEAAAEPGLNWSSYFQDFNGLNEPARTNFWKYWVFDNPNWDWWTFNFDTDMKKTDNKLAGPINAMNPDISAFEDAGGKLIQYHGWADPVVPSLESINYYDRVLGQEGGSIHTPSILRQTQSFYRLFMVPGMGHCSGGPGPTSFAAPMQSALEQWVEQGTAPASIVGTSYLNNTPSEGVAYTRPLCPYPQKPYYQGGDPDAAASFVCKNDLRNHPTPIPAPEWLR